MGHVIGIDLGTTNSCLATIENGSASVIASAEGRRTIPSVVSFSKDNIMVGSIARRQMAVSPKATVSSVKRFMGMTVEEVSDEMSSTSYDLVAGRNNAVRISIDGKEHSPEEISSLILSKIKEDAERYLGEEVKDAVITVPAYFNDAQRQATKHAAEIAGLNPLRLINEPTAAALAYGFNTDKDEMILVFDLGGGTLDVSILEIGDGVFDVIATYGDNHLGGDDFDRIIVEWILNKLKEDEKEVIRRSPSAMQRLYTAAEEAKIELSTLSETIINTPFLEQLDSNPIHIEVLITQDDLNTMSKNLLDKMLIPVKKAVKKANKEIGDIEHVILVGGMTRMPAIKDQVEKATGLKAHRGVNPDEAVALGAALQAGSLSGEIDDILLLDVIPLSLGIETYGSIMTRLIDANTTVPVKFVEVFSTAEDNQPSVEVHILQGEREMAYQNRSLGKVKLLGIPPAQAGVPQIEVSFDVSADGMLSVSGKDLGTGNHQKIQIKSTSGLTDEEIDEIKREALENRQGDLDIRAEAEEKITCEVVIHTVQKQIKENDLLEEDESNLLELIMNLETAISSEKHYTKIKSLRQELVTAAQDILKLDLNKESENIESSLADPDKEMYWSNIRSSDTKNSKDSTEGEDEENIVEENTDISNSKSIDNETASGAEAEKESVENSPSVDGSKKHINDVSNENEVDEEDVGLI